MAPACVKLWARCLQDLQQLPALSNDPIPLAVVTLKVSTTLAQWRELPPLSTRDWRKLVLEVKAPDVLFAVCCSVVQHSQSEGFTLATMTAFNALYRFFKTASKQGGFLFETNDRSGMNSSITSNSAHSSSSSSRALSLAPGIRSQVLQSGLMGAFATAMAAATDVLVRHPPQYQPATQTSASSSTAAAGAIHSERVSFTTQGKHVSELLQTWHWVCRLWPEGREHVAAIAIAAPAAVQLSAAILQLVSRDLPAALAAAQAQAPQASGSEDLAGPSGAVDSAKSYAGDLCYAVFGAQQTLSWLAYCVFMVLESRDVDMPELRPVLVMPEFTTSLATNVVLLTQALSAQQWRGPTAAATSTPSCVGNTSSKSSRSNSGCGVHGAAGSSRPLPNSSIPSTVSITSGGMASLLSTEKTQQKLKVMLRNLPECTKALLDTLGMDSKAVVWAAAAQHQQASSMALTVTAMALVVVFGQQPDNDQRQQQLLLLVSATLLHWASNARIQSLAQAQERAAIVAGPCTSFIIHLCSSFPKQSDQQHNADHCREDAALAPVTPAELKQVLPDIQKVLAVLLQDSWEPQPPGSSLLSSNGEVEPGAPGLLARLQCRILQSALGREEHDENWTPAAVLKMFTVGTTGRLSSTFLQPAEAQIVQKLAEFRSMTVQTLASLEGFVRASAQQLAAGTMPDSRVGLSATGPLAVVYGVFNAALFRIPLTEPGPLLSLAMTAGPGSPEQQQLYSLSSSLLKLSALVANSSEAALADFARALSFSCLSIACAAIKLLELAQDSDRVDSRSNGSSTATQQPTGAPEAAAGSSTLVAPSMAAAVTLLPNLVLVGRCCLIWAQHLPQAVPQLLRVHAGMGTVPPQALEQYTMAQLTPIPAAPVLVLLCWPPDPQESEPPGSLPASQGLQSALSFVSHWLTHAAVADQLAGAGHDTQQLAQLLQELVSAHRTVTDTWAFDNFTEATAMDLVQQLQLTGRALAGLAVPTMCCNPSCSNITGPSDLQLVSGRSCLCGGCRTARYCSRVCQKAAWKQHKPACSALAAASAAAAVTGAAAELEPHGYPQATS